MTKTIKPFFLLFLLLTSLSACGGNLRATTLNIGVLDEPYSDSFVVEDSPFTWNDDIVLSITGGSLPPGMYMTSSGELLGTPTAIGDYDFRVTAYTFENNLFEEDDVYQDSENFTLFVTEASTNYLCSDPNDLGTTETFICAGDLITDNLYLGDQFDLDINYFVDFDRANEYAINSIDFSVQYDPTYYSPIFDQLTSQILREAATRTDATISFSEPQAGELRMTVTGTTKALRKSGRFLDLPFEVVANVPAGETVFTVTVHGIDAENEDALSVGFGEVDGLITITDGIYEDEESEENLSDADVIFYEEEIEEELQLEL